ncbi:putative tRNA 2'-phosphotransferase 1 [Apostichopus japonicus]|uniref:2'-phosphotransferase n=1 Tax=Stichopus japonicus TaxID=307972 RepID=A0A2G8JWC1_STIJA|nr:putative tRNA 2'-phosphotransferase 1 [Apostichopus japonicus]
MSDTSLSKTLSFVLRHKAPELGFTILPGGYIPVDEILAHHMFRRYSKDDIVRVVNQNQKKRFDMKVDPGRGDLIAANQGHSFLGLKKMNRTHIHFAQGEPGDGEVISGMRGSCQLMIYINLEKALSDGLSFFVSKNGVVLSPGDPSGCISPSYFSDVVQSRPRDVSVPLAPPPSPPCLLPCACISKRDPEI